MVSMITGLLDLIIMSPTAFLMFWLTRKAVRSFMRLWK